MRSEELFSQVLSIIILSAINFIQEDQYSYWRIESNRTDKNLVKAIGESSALRPKTEGTGIHFSRSNLSAQIHEKSVWLTDFTKLCDAIIVSRNRGSSPIQVQLNYS
jgi:hypothetical protein